MTKYLVVYDTLPEDLVIIPRKISETINGDFVDVGLPPDQKKNFSEYESFILVFSSDADPSNMIEFFSGINLKDKDFDFLSLSDDKDKPGDKTIFRLRNFIENSSGKIFLQETLDVTDRNKDQLLQQATEFAFRIFKL